MGVSLFDSSSEAYQRGKRARVLGDSYFKSGLLQDGRDPGKENKGPRGGSKDWWHRCVAGVDSAAEAEAAGSVARTPAGFGAALAGSRGLVRVARECSGWQQIQEELLERVHAVTSAAAQRERWIEDRGSSYTPHNNRGEAWYVREKTALNICKKRSPHSSTGKHRTPLTLNTMANSKEVVPATSVSSSGFVEELLPSSQQVCLLYHISYLCLAKFPKLERLLQMRAVETQLLFGSSEAVMLKCVGTSKNLVSSLFPMLIEAVEKNKPALAIKYLEKARTWITEMIHDVEKMVDRYNTHNEDVATTTRDITTEKSTIPEPTHLGEVQYFLSKIQKILVQLKGFWEKVYMMLGAIKDKTFLDEDLIDDPEYKEEFVMSIQAASKVWEVFGISCGKAVQIFRVQSKDAYSFLEIDPSSLSEDVWQKEYDSVKEKLQELKITVDPPSTPAIQN
ncbi:hypothetical protein SRHO_G00075580 [Serrasalmus rhombeus]